MRRVDGVDAYLQLSLHSAATAAQLPCLRASLRQCNFVLVWLEWTAVDGQLLPWSSQHCLWWPESSIVQSGFFSDDNNAPIEIGDLMCGAPIELYWRATGIGHFIPNAVQETAADALARHEEKIGKILAPSPAPSR